MLAARGDRGLMTDADMSTPLDDVVALSRALDDGADLAIGSRALGDSRVLVHQPIVREVLGKGFNVLLRVTVGVPWRDTQCGFKLFQLETTRQLFAAQRIEGFAFDAELCVNARRLGLRLVEVPVRWSNHPESRVRMASSSTRMALDVLRIARNKRRPWVQSQERARLVAQPVQVADAPVIAVGLATHHEPLGGQ
jgi:dolichyl-phosphate beta-glucosyltransferase